MSIDPGPPKRSFLPFVLVLCGSIGVFVVVLGVAAFMTRGNPSISSTDAGAETVGASPNSDAGAQPAQVIVVVDGGDAPNQPPLNGTDAGEARALTADAGNGAVSVPPEVAGDAGSRAAVDAGPPAPATDLQAMTGELGATLAACIQVALRRDPGASTRATVRIKSIPSGAVVSAVSPSASPYFRRCAIGATSAIAISKALWLNVDKNGALTFVDDSRGSGR